MEVVGESSGFTDFTAEVTVEKVASSSASNIKLHFVITESEIQEYWHGMSELNYVARLMVPNQYGTSIDFSGGNTQVDINYYVNGSDLSTYQWTGTLGFLETADVDLPSINFDGQENNTVTVYTTNPNGNPDEYTNNDTIKQDFETAMIVEQTVNIMLRLDNNPEEISWEVKNSAGEVIYSGGSYTTAGQTINETFELDQTECYLFSIYDTGGDGLVLPGFFLLYYGSNTSILQGTTFGSLASTEFTTGYVGIEENITSQDFSVFPNPFTNKTNISFLLNFNQNVTIDVYNMIGEKVKTIKQESLTAGSHTIEFDGSELSNGVYFITLNTGDKVLTKKIMIN